MGDDDASMPDEPAGEEDAQDDDPPEGIPPLGADSWRNSPPCGRVFFPSGSALHSGGGSDP
eukprot:13581619-Alexandrium_andersonii.AAC.1